MILFMILLCTLLLLAVFTVLAVSAGGAIFIVVFADVFVCMFIIIWIMKCLIHKGKKR